MKKLIETILNNTGLNSFSFENEEIKHMQKVFKSLNGTKLEYKEDFEKENFKEAQKIVNNLVMFIRENKIETILLLLFSTHIIDTYVKINNIHKNVLYKENILRLFSQDFLKVLFIFDKQIKKEIKSVKNLLTLDVLDGREDEVNALFEFITIDLFNIYIDNNVYLNHNDNESKQAISNLETIIYNDLKYFKSKII